MFDPLNRMLTEITALAKVTTFVKFEGRSRKVLPSIRSKPTLHSLTHILHLKDIIWPINYQSCSGKLGKTIKQIAQKYQDRLSIFFSFSVIGSPYTQFRMHFLLQAKKVFTIQGPYYHVRDAMRRRGWIEKFYKVDAPAKKSPRAKRKAKESDDSDQDDDDDGDVDDDDGMSVYYPLLAQLVSQIIH